jgi:outer membrane immunogenic protein
MRQFLFASAALLALAGVELAHAADAPPNVIYPAGAYPAAVYPAATAPFTFAGFYAGATVGGALGGTKYLETPGGGFGPYTVTFMNPAPPPPTLTGLVSPAASVAGVGTSSTAPRGVLGGLEAGYNWQFGHFVVGVETDFSGWDMSSSSGMSAFGAPPAILNPPPSPGTLPPSTLIAYTASGTVTSNWLYTLRPRVGFANGNMLTFLTAGLAVTNLRFSESITLGTGAPILTGSLSNTVVGWTVGGGVEYALSYNWFIKAEYLYANFSNQTASQTVGAFPSLTGTATANLNANILRGGFDYRF